MARKLKNRKKVATSMYPGCIEAEKQKLIGSISFESEKEPDFVGNAPNYDKFERLGMSVEEMLVWLNID